MDLSVIAKAYLLFFLVPFYRTMGNIFCNFAFGCQLTTIINWCLQHVVDICVDFLSFHSCFQFYILNIEIVYVH